MPQVITQELVRTVFTGFKAVYQQAFGKVPAQWSRVAMKVPSSTEQETYGWLGQLPHIREWIGDRVIQGVGTHGATVRNRKFESTIGVSRDKLEDDTMGVLRPLVSEMGRSAAEFPDELVFSLLAQGFTSRGYDGQLFFDADHPVLDAAGVERSVSNVQPGSGPAWFLMDTRREVRPMILQVRREFDFVQKNDPRTSEHVFMRDEYLYGVDGRMNAGFGLWQLAAASKAPLTKGNLRALRTMMTTLKGDHGRPLNVRPDIIVVPPQLEDAARDILLAERDEYGASNVDHNLVEIVTSGWLA